MKRHHARRPIASERGRWLRVPAAAALLLLGFVTAAATDEAPASGLAFSVAEQQWLQAHPRVRLAAPGGSAPIAFFDEAGVFTGIAADYLALVARRLGIAFDIRRVDSPAAGLRLLAAREADLLVDGHGLVAESNGELLYTRPFLSLPGVILTPPQESEPVALERLRGQRVAAVQGSPWARLLAERYPQIEYLPVPDVATGLRVAGLDQADAFVTDAASAGYWLEREPTAAQINGRVGSGLDLALAVRSDWPLLNALLQKGLDAIGAEQRGEIRRRWLDGDEPLDLRGIGIGALVVVLLLVWVLLWVLISNHILKRKVDRRTRALTQALLKRRRVEKELKRHRERLKELVEIRTQELRESQERLNLALRSTGFGIRDWDLPGDRIRLDEGARRLLAFADAECHGGLQPLLVQIHPDDRASVVETIADAMGQDREYELSYRVEPPGEAPRVVAERGHAYRGDGGGVERQVAVLWDVTERHQTQHRLEESEARFRRLVEGLRREVMFFTVEPDGLISYVSPSVENLFGYTAAEAARRFRDFFSDSPLNAELDQNFRRALAGEQLPPREYEVICRDGGRRFVEIYEVPVVDVDGQVERIQGVLHDVTTRHRNAEALRAAKEAAEAATEVRSRFLANMSHEIRTPLNGIIGFANLARQSGLTPLQEDYVAKIGASAGVLLELVNNILDFSKIEAGKLAVEPVEFDLWGLLDELGELCAAQAAERGTELVIARAPEVPARLVGDALRLRQVLVNLLANALKFTERGEVVLRVARCRGDALRLRFEVSDTGIGIRREQIDGLFNAFTQADGSTTRKYGGTGLGLSICKQLVELMEGEIGVESEIGEGSSFWFELPFTPAAGPGISPARLPPHRVLIVDDSPSSLRMLGEAVATLGLEAVTAGSVKEAFDQLLAAEANAGPIALLILDAGLAGNGAGMLERMRQIPRLDQLPVVMLAPSAGDREPLADPQRRVQAWLNKPVASARLAATLTELLGDAAPAAVPTTVCPAARARVLVAEDNAITRDLIRHVLEQAGVEVDAVEDGLAAVAAAAEERYDLILLDCHMPRLDGLDAAVRIRGQRGAAPPIVLLTPQRVDGTGADCAVDEADATLRKPVFPQQLQALLARWLSPARVARRAPAGSGDPPLPERLAGFELAIGLARLQGDRGLYRQLLGEFVRHHRDDPARLRAALADGHWQQARERAHHLRGSAGSLAATGVEAAASVLESLLVNGAAGETAVAAGERLATTLEAVVDGLIEVGLAAAEPDVSEDAQPLDPALRGRLIEAADLGDLTALTELVRELPDGSGLRRRLADLIARFDLEGLEGLAAELRRAALGEGAA